MKKILFTLVLAVIASLSAVAANAQTHFAAGNANVPFAFNFGSVHCQPGTYRLTNANTFVLLINGVKGAKTSGFAMYYTSYEGRPAAATKAVFEKIGDRYYLTEIWEAGSTVHMVVLPSRQQKEAERESAAVKNSPERVELAMGASTSPASGN